MAHISIKGLEAAIREVKRAEKKLQDTVKDAISEVIDLMIEEAKRNAPKDIGDLINSIDKESKDAWTMVFFVGEVHGAFQEFGLAGLRNVQSNLIIPEEMEEVAREFKSYKGGNFKDFVKEIEEWCGRKGIDEGAAYAIAVKILNYGLEARPYFYPAYEKYKPEVLKRVKERVQELFNGKR